MTDTKVLIQINDTLNGIQMELHEINEREKAREKSKNQKDMETKVVNLGKEFSCERQKKEEKFYKSFGRSLKKNLDNKSISYSEFAKSVDITETKLTHIMEGKVKLSSYEMFKIANKLGLDQIKVYI